MLQIAAALLTVPRLLTSVEWVGPKQSQGIPLAVGCRFSEVAELWFPSLSELILYITLVSTIDADNAVLFRYEERDVAPW